MDYQIFSHFLEMSDLYFWQGFEQLVAYLMPVIFIKEPLWLHLP
jgi:hypothetical protein